VPDTTGALTAVDVEKVKSWFNVHWKGSVVCPVCKNMTWTYSPHIVKAPRWASDAFAAGTVAYAYLPVSCNTCGHTIFFNANTLGIMQAAPTTGLGALYPPHAVPGPR
jgi:predicted nucleic-acid-binding Zn-ribbon protein